MEKNKIIKISIFSVLCVLVAYLLYLSLGSYISWFAQPRFISDDGIVTCSWGFLVQGFIFSGLFVIFSAILVFCAIKLFKKPKHIDNNQ